MNTLIRTAPASGPRRLNRMLGQHEQRRRTAWRRRRKPDAQSPTLDRVNPPRDEDILTG